MSRRALLQRRPRLLAGAASTAVLVGGGEAQDLAKFAVAVWVQVVLAAPSSSATISGQPSSRRA